MTDEKLLDAEVAVHVRPLLALEWKSLLEVHRAVIAALPDPRLYRDVTADYLKDHISARGKTIGAFSGENLIGYAVIRYPFSDKDNLGSDLGLSPDQLRSVAHFELSGVLPAFRGRGLQLRLNSQRMLVAEADGFAHAAVTVAPTNSFSLHTHFRCGIYGRRISVKYGGMHRLVLCRHLLQPEPVFSNCVVYADAEDVSGIEELFEAGLWASVATPGVPRIGFRAPMHLHISGS
ncbi:hypothetical protein ACRAWG_00570 [Methylobacterium sp. P31]